MNDALTPLLEAYDPETFRAQGHALVDLLADYLARAASADRGLPVMPNRVPETMLRDYGAAFPRTPNGPTWTAGFLPLVKRVLDDSTHLHHPGYVGHQVSAPLPFAALCDLVSALANNGTAVFEMGAASTAMELSVLSWMASVIGWDQAKSGGVLTSGGSVGNLTALLAMRQAYFDVWEGGAHEHPRLAVMVSREAHYSISRATRIMGWGKDGVVPVETDARFRMRPDALPEALAAARARGLMVIGVVSSSCGTAVGAFDPIEPLADFCADNRLWLHVDGAHGGSAILSPTHARLLRGIARADSVVWDAHKMMSIPALVTAVLFRDGARGAQAFAQHASYLFSRNKHDTGERTLECTKRMMSLGVYSALTLLGTDAIGAHVQACFDLGQRFARLIEARGGLELACEPECNIVCFRATRAGLDADALDELQLRIRARILAAGEFYLVRTKLPKGIFLRVTLINPLTREADLLRLLDRIELLRDGP